MRPLLTLSARFSAAVVAVVLILGFFSGVVRLLPWLAAPEVPLRICLPFAELLVSATIEAAVLVGPPVGVAIAAALFVERGEAVALEALGASPARLARALLAPAVVLALIYAGSCSLRDPDPPGRLATRLLEFGAAGCRGGGSGRVDVPLISLSWLCFRPAPRVAGRVPGVGGDVWFSALGVSFAQDLRTISLDDLHVAGTLRGASTQVRFNVARARLAGLPGWGRWGRPETLMGPARGAVVSAGGFGTALLLAWLVVRARLSRPVPATAVAASAAIGMLTALHSLDGRAANPVFYGVVPLVGAVIASAGIAGMLVVFGGRVAERAP
jgi:hypothetical protein